MAGHVLVTGAGGLIGRALLHVLPPGLDVAVVHTKDVDLLAPGAFPRLIRDSRPSVVVHLAWTAKTRADFRESAENARWRTVTREAAVAAVGAGVRFIATGSVADSQPAADAYSEAKGELRTDLADMIGSGQVTWLRPHYVFDPGAPSPELLRAALAARSRGEPVRLRQPYSQHDFVHVGDVARAIGAVIHNELVGVVDIGYGVLTPVHTLIERFGSSWVAESGAMTTAQTDPVADVTRLTDVGWHPTETEGFLS